MSTSNDPPRGSYAWHQRKSAEEDPEPATMPGLPSAPPPPEERPPTHSVAWHRQGNAPQWAPSGSCERSTTQRNSIPRPAQNHTVKEKLASVTDFAIGAVVLAAILALAGLAVQGGAWLSEKLLPLLTAATAIALMLSLFILLPLSVIPAARGFAGIMLFIASYVFGALLWTSSLILTYNLWGGVAVLIGLFLLGIGVVPGALLATLHNGLWSELAYLVLLLAATFGARLLGLSMAQSHERRYG